MIPFYYLMKEEFQSRYSSSWVLVAEIFMMNLGLLIYWYTAKAFVPAFAWKPGDTPISYFNYLFVGEITLFIPMILLHGIIRTLRSSVENSTLEAMLVMPVRLQTPVILLGCGTLLRESLRVVFLLASAMICFGFHLPLHWILAFFTLQIFGIPAFFGLGLLGCAFVIRFGRGESAITYLGSLAMILAGAYFPTSVFSPFLQHIALIGSPFSVLLDSTRSLLNSGWNSGIFLSCISRLLLWGIPLFSMGYFAIGQSLAWVQRKGTPLLLQS